MNDLELNNIEQKENIISQDDKVRHEAALCFSNGEPRQAINLLIQRINETNGHCDPKIWLMLLDIYRIQGQQPPYEKLAIFFSNRFHFSPPAWEEFENPKDVKKSTQGQWRNSLTIEGSPSIINYDKIRDFIKASKDMNQSRIDFSRIRLEGEARSDEERKDISIILNIMKKLRKIQCPTLLMGEAELLDILKNRIKQSNGIREKDELYWFTYLEFLQWRGKSEEFDDLAIKFADMYMYCPVGYEDSGAIAVSPKEEEDMSDNGNGYEPHTIISEATSLLEYAQNKWSEGQPAEINMAYVKRMTSEVARDIASFLQAQHQANNRKKEDTVFLDTTEVISALLEMTGAEAYSIVRHQNEKLRNVLEK